MRSQTRQLGSAPEVLNRASPMLRRTLPATVGQDAQMIPAGTICGGASVGRAVRRTGSTCG
jgi:hypothetical protein